MFNFPYFQKENCQKKIDIYLGAGSRSNVKKFVVTCASVANSFWQPKTNPQKNLWSGKFIGIVYRTYKVTLN